MARKKSDNPVGRPKKELDKDIFEELCKIQCTGEEICAVLSVSADTLREWCMRTYDGANFSQAYKKFADHGKMSLRRTQFRIAERNASMAIWLGKQYLGQRDYIEMNGEESIKQLDSLITAIKENRNEYSD